jgi:hypothetical protein
VTEPYLSLVVTARNDDHGGNLLGRMQAFINNWLNQARRFQLPSELIIVEWNPPEDRPRLAEALRWPSEPGPCSVRIIEVPPELHRRFAHADALPLYQMIGKNVGIRRARGRFVLATNIDILFSSELAAFLAEQRLDPGRMYRIDRHDTGSDVPVDAEPEEQLEYCRTHLIRINRRGATYPAEVFPSDEPATNGADGATPAATADTPEAAAAGTIAAAPANTVTVQSAVTTEATPAGTIAKDSAVTTEATPAGTIAKESAAATEATPADTIAKESAATTEAAPADTIAAESVVTPRAATPSTPDAAAAGIAAAATAGRNIAAGALVAAAKAQAAGRALHVPGIALRDGWFPEERYGNQEVFRWAGRRARVEIAQAPSSAATLVMEVAPGPGSRDPIELEIVGPGGFSTAVALGGRGRLFIRAEWPIVKYLEFRVKNRLVGTLRDPRPLAFRVFSIRWTRYVPGGPRPSSAKVGRLPLSRRAAILMDGFQHVASRLAHEGPVVNLSVFVSPTLRTLLRPLAGPPPETDDHFAQKISEPLTSRLKTPKLKAPKPKTLKPTAYKAPASEPPTSEAKILRPEFTEPKTPEPVLAEPKTPEPVLAEPKTPEPVLAEPKTPKLELGEVAAFEPETSGAEDSTQPVIPDFLHTNGCGDFTLLSRDRWFDLRAYPEFDLFSMNLDSVFCYTAHHGGAPEVVLDDPMRIYHIEHGTGSGWTPEGQAKLFRRIQALGLSFLDNDTVMGWAQQMKRLRSPMIFNAPDWGFAADELPETTPVVGINE